MYYFRYVKEQNDNSIRDFTDYEPFGGWQYNAPPYNIRLIFKHFIVDQPCCSAITDQDAMPCAQLAPVKAHRPTSIKADGINVKN